MFRNDRKRSLARKAWRVLYPRGGWVRAVRYLSLRVLRLPDSPDRIARGVFAGTLVAFTPLFGLHFLIAPVLALIIGGNLIASIFFVLVCNPLTFVPIAVSAITVGNAILGGNTASVAEITGVITGISDLLQHNLVAVFTDDRMQYLPVRMLFEGLFLPYMLGGILIGLVAGMVLAWISRVSIEVYQRRKHGRVSQETLQSGKTD